jgi:phosphoribosylanthranilate isomerase
MRDKSPPRVKICGITNAEDALMAVEAGADALGFIFYPKSPRYITPEEARLIKTKLPPFVATVGVFVDEDAGRVMEIAREAGLGAVQLHGHETPAYCTQMGISVIKALRVRDEGDIRTLARYEVSAFLLDTYKEGQMGGTGEVFDWDLALKAKQGKTPIILSGGLNPDNVAKAVEKVRPYAVDVSSGVEVKPGVKNRDKVRDFIKNVKG